MVDPVTSFTGMTVMVLVALAAFAVVLVAGRRRDDGPGTAGGLPVYLAAVMLVMLVVAVVSVGVAASALVRQGLEPSGTRTAPVPIRPGQASAAGPVSPTAQLVGAAITAVLAGGLFELHRRRLHRITEAEGPAGPAGSVHRSYAAAVSLAAAVLVVLSGGQAALGATRAIAPGDAGDAPPRRIRPGATAGPAVQPERDAGAVQVLGNGVVFALAAGVWVYHRRRIDEAPASDESATMGP